MKKRRICKMDEYIRMCGEANEIQEQWQPQQADTYYLKDNFDNMCTRLIKDTNWKEGAINTQNGVWIPRQEDYQRIILNYQISEKKIEDWTPWVLIQKLYRYMDEPQIKWNSNIDLNQIYLQLTMETLYNKKWDKETGRWIWIE
jgi:hypothetical protein